MMHFIILIYQITIRNIYATGHIKIKVNSNNETLYSDRYIVRTHPRPPNQVLGQDLFQNSKEPLEVPMITRSKFFKVNRLNFTVKANCCNVIRS